MAGIGIICGMEAEARALGDRAYDDRISVAISGARPHLAETAARTFAGRGVGCLVSFGIAGALERGLTPGDLLVGRAVATGMVTIPLANPGANVPGRRVSLAGSDTIVPDAAAKADLARVTGAAAVDMETHRVALAARDFGIPCYAIRAVSDPADRALPASAADALGEDGRPRIGHVLLGLARRPQDLPALLSAKRDSDAGLASLRAVADDLMSALIDL
ncbi:MAG: phosphorylase [Pseudomonadota bacterium]